MIDVRLLPCALATLMNVPGRQRPLPLRTAILCFAICPSLAGTGEASETTGRKDLNSVKQLGPQTRGSHAQDLYEQVSAKRSSKSRCERAWTRDLFANPQDFGATFLPFNEPLILEGLVVARHLVPSTRSSTSAGRGRSATSLAIC